MTGYYDYTLRLVPLAFSGITDTLTVAGLQLTTVVPMAVGAITPLTSHAFFVNGPSSSPPSRLNEHVGPNTADASSLSVLDAD